MAEDRDTSPDRRRGQQELEEELKQYLPADSEDEEQENRESAAAIWVNASYLLGLLVFVALLAIVLSLTR